MNNNNVDKPRKVIQRIWICTLKERRKRHKLLMFHKMINHQCPGYLLNLVPPLVSTTNPFFTRSGCVSNILENLHLEAIRIILGAVRGTSHEKLCKESGFCTLKERRKRHKLLMFHKMINHQCPGYLSNL